ncbi:glycerate kinase [Microbacterium sp. ASV49]|uniref:Glycerate kinase n=1 Tax=Microbacterium candidum TaxID=3041922 RepID=A0ABT7N206_9MICO|nr:glycerate kinase [Microbacterium sp. ASV49]MDL9980742.1 glycerate kinase [Microbacterium sp. ASV49]
MTHATARRAGLTATQFTRRAHLSVDWTSHVRVLIAMDSFKGSIDSSSVAAAVAAGWKDVRPNDDVVRRAMGDGGEGTAAVIAAAVEGSVAHVIESVTGPDGRDTRGEWFMLPDRTAVLDLAQMSGLPLMGSLDPLGATTRGLGETIRAALSQGATAVWICLGGSASTDAGVGALRALGLKATDCHGDPVGEGGIGLSGIASIDTRSLLEIPGGVTLLTDVTSPLTGPSGAAAVFGPQKGASLGDVAILDSALAHFAEICGAPPQLIGAGAAGGTAYGFHVAYGAEIVSGADRVAEITDLDTGIASADLVITGEGSFDSQSRRGKVVGSILDRAERMGVRGAIIAGRILHDPGTPHVSLTDIAGSSEEALRNPSIWAQAAGSRIARIFHGP